MFTSSCQRTRAEVWEDSKTAGRYMDKGLRAVSGKHSDSRQVASKKSFVGPTQEEYIPLDDEDIYRQLTLGDTESLEKITQDTAIPQSGEAPGEVGSAIPGVDDFSNPKNGELAIVFRSINFAYNGYKVRGKENLARLDRIVDYLQRHGDVYIFIEGHCDERGPAAYNLALGTRRANSVRNLLIKQGVDLNRIFTVSYGKERPIVQGENEGSWWQNRRAQFKIYEKSR